MPTFPRLRRSFGTYTAPEAAPWLSQLELEAFASKIHIDIDFLDRKRLHPAVRLQVDLDQRQEVPHKLDLNFRLT